MMFARGMTIVCLVGLLCSACAAAEDSAKPEEVQVLKSYLGVWDATIQVWAASLESPPIQFKGVETNRAYGEYWVASDFDSQMEGESLRIHSIVGYDLERKKLVATVIDDGPYAASMTGSYDEKSKTVHWTTKVKGPDGTPLVQKTTDTLISADERLLVLSVPDQKSSKFKKFMQIKFVRRKE